MFHAPCCQQNFVIDDKSIMGVELGDPVQGYSKLWIEFSYKSGLCILITRSYILYHGHVQPLIVKNVKQTRSLSRLLGFVVHILYHHHFSVPINWPIPRATKGHRVCICDTQAKSKEEQK